MFGRSLLKGGGRLGMLAAVESLLPAYVWSSEANAAAQTPRVRGNVIDLTITDTPFRVNDRTATAMTTNGTLPGPVVRLTCQNQPSEWSIYSAKRN
jgi:FtsP/CotA-like multicopper oxidase with cupredoxin domain